MGSTRPQRNGEAVSQWVHELAQQRNDAKFELIDLADVDLPLLDEPIPPSQGRYGKDHYEAMGHDHRRFRRLHLRHGGIRPWHSRRAEERHRFPPNKVAGFVSYGSANGVRAVEQLRLVMAELRIATVRAQVSLSLMTDFKDMREFTPAE